MRLDRLPDEGQVIICAPFRAAEAGKLVGKTLAVGYLIRPECPRDTLYLLDLDKVNADFDAAVGDWRPVE